MVGFSLKNCHCRAEDKVEKKALRKNGQSGGWGPQSVWGRGLDSAISETRLAVLEMGMSVGGGGRALPLKPDPPRWMTITHMPVGFPRPILVPFFLPLPLTLDVHHMVLF